MVSSTAHKKSAKSSKSTDNMQPKVHPAWSDMITECIATTPDGHKYGVSRPAIKKFVHSKYHLPMSASAINQLSRAITHGAVSGQFILPKGPSGKVKLAPKRDKKQEGAVETRARERPVATKTNTPFAEEQPSKTTRKYTSIAKKARVTPFPGRQVPPKKATMQRSGAKRALTRLRSAVARTKKGAAKRRGK